jgi:hypothetical protein
MYMQFRKCGASSGAYCHHNRGRVDEFVLDVLERAAGAASGITDAAHPRCPVVHLRKVNRSTWRGASRYEVEYTPLEMS